MRENYLVLLLKELVILPNQEIKIELISEISKDIINKSILEFEKKVFIVAPMNDDEKSPDINDLPKIGVVAQIKSSLALSNGNLRLVLRGIKRLVVKNYIQKDEYLSAHTEDIVLPKFNPSEEKAVRRKLKASLKKYIENNSLASNSILAVINTNDSLNKLTDIITVFLPFDKDKKQQYVEIINPLIRGKNLIKDLEKELEILKIEEEIEENLRFKLVEKEKEYLLREKLTEIKKALGEEHTNEEEYEKYIKLLNTLKLNSQTFIKLENEINKYKSLSKESPELAILKNYLDTVLNLPWNKVSKEETNPKKVNVLLNKSHYGLDEIKERVEEYIEIKNIKKHSKTPIMCLVGPPGVGKSTIAYSIAKALNREFVKISVAGLNDSTELLGNRKTYIGASYGKIIGAIKKTKVNNPVILIDEVDKMLKDYKGDPASVLLDVLDYSLNKEFVDNYIEEPFSLENVLFILTANNKENIPYPLLDRLELYEVNSYTIKEKEKIAKDYLIPKINFEYNSSYKFSPSIITNIINHYTNEAGVRELERLLYKLIRKLIINKKEKLLLSDLKLYLGEYKYTNIFYNELNEIGIVNYLAYTPLGGICSKIEISITKGPGEVITTGMLGKTIEESIKVALSYIKINYNIEIDKYNIHLHFLDSSILKEGPSAGLSIVTALLSVFLNKQIPNNIAFSGEISLNGNIIKVGGIKEKIISAYNNNIEILYLPFENKIDVLQLKEYTKNIKIIYLKNYKELFNILF